MLLKYSAGEEIFLQEHRAWIESLMEQEPADVIRKYPQMAMQLLRGCGVETAGKMSRKVWQTFLRDFFFSKLVGPHYGLKKIFASPVGSSGSGYSIGPFELCSVLGIGSDACACRTVDGYCLKVSPADKKEKLAKEYALLQQLKHIVI